MHVCTRTRTHNHTHSLTSSGTYRNSADDVFRFFVERHHGHFKIYNLVAERGYYLNQYAGAVMRYPFMDHNAPALELLLPCCASMHRYLQEDSANVVAVHCKAGKGRTGLIIVCYLLFGGLHSTATSARSFYDFQRCHDKKGLTITSQIRYAHYFEKLLSRLKNGEDIDVSESRSPAIGP
jgi:phosphatidylinositol-3,4,5-trisphosphate 3-phosphatase/dual-specificity protein phosphatase PTEN